MMLILGSSSKAAILLFVTSILAHHANSLSEPNFVNSRCMNTSGNYTSNSTYKKSIDLILTELANISSMSGSVSKEVPDKAYGLFFCRGDLDTEICTSCIKAASKEILSYCPVQKDAVIWYKECTLRFFANDSVSFLEEDGNWGGEFSFTNVSDPRQFIIKLTRAISPMINNAAFGSDLPGFAIGVVNISKVPTLYCLVQCSPFVTGDYCNQCLNGVLDKINTCCSNGSTSLMIFNPSCQLRYDVLPFYNLDLASDSKVQSPGSSPAGPSIVKSAPKSSAGNNGAYYVTRVAVPAALATFLLASICLWQRTKLLELMNPLKYGVIPRQTIIQDQGAINFSFGEIKKATNNFSKANELGKGGFGAVYKGKLKNGDDVAVKRLSTESAQGVNEFTIEVDVLAKLQHRNLVRLSGYCNDNKENILVYEYVDNLSLDKLLFDPKMSKKLDWSTRKKIIVGIAKGLQYLHSESRLNVVHRDLKVSNILLDADMEPKIADFGLARKIDINETRGNTLRPAGTMGYIAPELILYGEFSTKSDVYSFGVILLEIVTGQKIYKTNDPNTEENLVWRAWRLWGEGKAEELLDATLRNDTNEVTRCMRIALLCLQQHTSARPSMQTILFYLNSNLVDLPLPIAPAVEAFDFSLTTSTMNPSNKEYSAGVYQLYRECVDGTSITQTSENDLYPC